jgi:hypothetical protein
MGGDIMEWFMPQIRILMLPFIVISIFGCAEMQQQPLGAEDYYNRGLLYFG